MGILSNRPLYSDMVIDTLAVDGWTVTSGLVRSGPPHSTKCNSPPINGQCTNFTLVMWHYNYLCTLKG